MTGAPYLRDLDDVRRAPTLDDLAMFHKLSHMRRRCIPARITSSSPAITRSATGTCASPIPR
jgi:trimethylamine:corrinoid methyltransferase-like protein